MNDRTSGKSLGKDTQRRCLWKADCRLTLFLAWRFCVLGSYAVGVDISDNPSAVLKDGCLN